MTPRAKQIILLVAVFIAGAVVGAIVSYTYMLSLFFDIQNEIK